MILYVLLTWLSALGLILLAELFTLSYFHHPLSFAAPTHQHLAQQSVAANPTAFNSVWILFLFVLGCFLGYTIELRLKPAKRLYDHFQKTYPAWYQKWHAPRRELSFGLWLASALLFINGITLSFTSVSAPYFGGIPLSLGLALGLIIAPALRYRKMLTEDRPEQAPQAVLHKIRPTYSSERALKIGQIYLRFLLPMFMLFLVLMLPMIMGIFTLTLLQGALLFLSQGVGLWLAYRHQPESHLSVNHFRDNLYQLSGLLALSSLLLLFGVASGNPVELCFFGAWSAYTCGVY